MTHNPLAAPSRKLAEKVAAIHSMRREDYQDLQRFRAALSARLNGCKRLIRDIETRAAKMKQ